MGEQDKVTRMSDLMPMHNSFSDQAKCLEQVLSAQRAAQTLIPYPTYEQRCSDLLQLKVFLQDNADAIAKAINEDFGHRSMHETFFAEIVPVVQAVEYAIKNLKQWMKPKSLSVDWLNFFGAKNYLWAQPLGVIGVIVPWNFPINLSFMVLVDAFAAGNRVMVKMSENSRYLTRLLLDLTPRYFNADKLSFFEETGEVGVAFSRLKFDHLVFTGSSQTGKAVMAAAAQNLCPVTLELGGKSPAVVCPDFDMLTAVKRIMFAKCFNAGQICTNVDHVYVPYGRIDDFVQMAQSVVQQRFSSLDSLDYTSIINEQAFERLVNALTQAKAQGATLIPLMPGNPWDASTRKIVPHLVLNLPKGCVLQTNEIFGPILPIIGYTELEEVVRAINSEPRPLAFYPFSDHSETVHALLSCVISGGVSVNDALFHAAQHSLPFGGVGDSGMGHYHGHDGFVTFSKMRPIFYQARFSPMRFMWPPYRKLAGQYLKFLMK